MNTITLSEIDKMPQTDNNVKMHQDRNNLICKYADTLARFDSYRQLVGMDYYDWKESVEFKESLTDKQEIKLFEYQYKYQ